MKKDRNQLAILFGILLFMIWVIGYVNHKRKLGLLTEIYEVTYGRIDQLGFNGGSSVVWPSYEYTVNNKTYKGTYSFDLYCRTYSRTQLSDILGKQIQVVYNPNDPSVSQILLRKADYIRYNQDYSKEVNDLLGKYFDCN